MASYDAQINILLSGQRNLQNLANQLIEIEESLQQIQRRSQAANVNLGRARLVADVFGRNQPRGPGGRFAADPGRQERFAALAAERRAEANARRLRRLAAFEQQAAQSRIASTRQQLEGEERLIQRAERRIALESRLNSAVTIFQRQQRAYARGGAGARLPEALQQQAATAQAAFEAAGGPLARNLRLVQSLAREMTTIAEAQREINRGSTLQSKGFYKSQEFERRIIRLREAGVQPSAFRTVGRQMSEYRSALARTDQLGAEDAARRIDENLKRISRELDQSFTDFRRADSARRAARSWQTFFEDAASAALQIRQNSAQTRDSWRTFFEDAASQALQIRQNTADTRQSWQVFFEDAANQALQIRQNAAETRSSWASFFESAANQALQIKQNAANTRQSWQSFFIDAANQALQIKQNATNTKESWQAFFGDAANQALQIKQNAIETRSSWQTFFSDAANQALQVRQNAAETKESWKLFFEDAANQALAVKQNAAQTKESWKTFFDDAASQALQVKQNAAETRESWQTFFIDAANQALQIKQNAAETRRLWQDFFADAANQALQIKQYAAEAKESWRSFFEDAANQALLIKQNAAQTKNSWKSFFESAAEQALSIRENAIQTKESWRSFFIDAANQALQINQNAAETRENWRLFFEDAGQQALQIRQNASDTRSNWQSFFEDAAQQALQIKENAVSTKESWKSFFNDAAGQALEIKQNAASTKKVWKDFFDNAANQALEIKQNAENTKNAWREFFVDATNQAQQIKQNAEATKQSWKDFFVDAAQQALQIQEVAKNTKNSWKRFFEDAANQALEIKRNAAETKDSWELFFEDAANQALSIKQSASDTRLAWQQFFKDAEEQAKAFRRNPIAAMTPKERRAAGILDPASLRASRRAEVERGRERQEAFRSAISEGLIGGAFPALFGQGAGASLGGLAGGGIGGFVGGNLGFGLSLLGTGLGSVFDQLNQAAQETGKALNSPIESFEQLKEAGLFASKQQEYYISKLIESGRTTEATAQIQAEMIRKIGVTGVNDLMRLGKASSDLSDAWNEFNLQLQAALAGPMAGLLKWLASVVGTANEISRSDQLVKDVSAGLTGKAKQKFDEEITRIGLNTLGEVEAAKQRAALAEFYRPLANMPRARQPENTPEQREKNLQIQMQNADKIRALAKQGEELDRRAVEMRRNNEETIYNLRKRAADMEREAADYRRSLEDKLADKRIEIERTIIENDRKRRQIQIEALDFQLEKAKGGMDPIADGIIDATRTYLRSRAEGEADLQQKERNMKLEIEKIERGTAQFKLEVEDRVRQMNEQRDAFSRDVAKTRLQMAEEEGRYLMDVEDYRLEQTRRRVELALQEQNGIARAEQEARQGGLTTPNTVDGFPITSLPGMRIDPFTGGQRHHKGVDVGAPTGTALGYEMAGKVLFAGVMEGYGKTIKVALDNGATLLAAHLNEVFVKQGQRFAANQRLATIGSTGRSTGPHLHHEGTRNGKADPIGTLDYVQLGKALQQAANTARATGVPPSDFRTRYLMRLSNLEGGYGANGSAARNPKSNARAYFQLIPSTERDLRQRGMGRIADQMLSKNFQEAASGAYYYATMMRPATKQLFAEGDVAGLDRLLNRLWTSLPGGKEEATGERLARGNQYLRGPSVVATGAAGVAPPAPILPPARPARPSMPGLPATPGRVGFQDLIARNGQLDAQSISLMREENGLTKEQNRLAQQRAMFAYQEQITSPITRLRQQNQELQLEIDKREILNPLIAQGADPELIRGREKIIELERTYNSILKGLNESSRVQVQDALAKYNINSDLIDSTFELTEATINDLAVKAAAIGKEEELRKKLQEILDLRNRLKKAAKGEADTAVDEIAKTTAASVKTPQKKIQERIDELSGELKKLTSVDALAIKSADNIGNAFGGAFRDIITGASSTQEALAGFFKNVADSFAAMAAEIIAKQITMIILQTILKALGAVAGGSSSGPNIADMKKYSTEGPISAGMFGGALANANGNIFGMAGLQEFANGGAFTNSIVSSPTLFQFADGGVMKMGVMGEAGDEAVMPLERDSSGRLGVRATGLAVPFGRSVETSDENGVQDVPFRREGVGLTVPFLKNQPGSALDQDVRGTIDVRFETVSIGGMDVVTREEAQRIGQEAAQRGAELAHKRYRNNPSARRAVGLA